MYSEEIKRKAIEAFKINPYYKTISAYFNVPRESLKRWIAKEGIDVEKLKNSFYLNGEKPKNIRHVDEVLLSNLDNYTKVSVIENTNDKKENVQLEKPIDENIAIKENALISFTLNGYSIIVDKKYLKDFIEELK